MLKKLYSTLKISVRKKNQWFFFMSFTERYISAQLQNTSRMSKVNFGAIVINYLDRRV